MHGFWWHHYWVPQQLLYKWSKVPWHFVLFQGCSWTSIGHVMSWVLHVIHTLHHDNSHCKSRQKYHAVFLYVSKIWFSVCVKNLVSNLSEKGHHIQLLQWFQLYFVGSLLTSKSTTREVWWIYLSTGNSEGYNPHQEKFIHSPGILPSTSYPATVSH